MTAVTLLPGPAACAVGWEIWLQHCGVVIQLLVPVQRALAGLLFGNHIVDASSLVFFLPLPGVNVF